MEFSVGCTQRRYCAGGEELLRAIVSVPTDIGGEELRVLADFCREINDRSFRFAEEQLFLAIRKEYERLSPHDKKFAVPRRVYRVEIAVETVTDETYGEALRMTLSVTLRRKGRTEFQWQETRLWAKYGKNDTFLMVDAERKGKCHRKV